MFGLFKKKAPAPLKPTVAEVRAKYADQIEKLTLSAAELVWSDAPSRSRQGGAVHLPPGFAWPQYKEKPMLLLIQIDLAEAVSAVPALLSRFPSSGLFQMFVDDETLWYSESSPGGPLRVFLHPDTGDFRLASGPGPPAEGTGLTFREIQTLPDDFLLSVYDDEESDLLIDDAALGDRVGGWPSPVQGDPTEEGGVLFVQFTVDEDGKDTVYVVCDPAALKDGRLEDVRVDVQFT